MRNLQSILIWIGLLLAILVPLLLAANSPLLAWREPIYVTAGFAGILALGCLLLQPLLVGHKLPWLSITVSRRLHRCVGITVTCAVILHVGALWLTSPPDVIDALLFTSPTPFSAWGVIAMWAVFAAGLWPIFRRRLRPRLWRRVHLCLVILIVLGSTIHAVQIEGAMEPWSKWILCGLLILATLSLIFGSWRRRSH